MSSDLYTSGKFNDSNEYKWTLLLLKLQQQLSRENVIFNSLHKDKFAKVLVHFFLQLQQIKDNRNIFFEGYISYKKLIKEFEQTYPDIYQEITHFIDTKDVTYSEFTYLKSCLSGLIELDLVTQNPAMESMISLNTDLIMKLNQEVNSKVNIADDIDDLLNLAASSNQPIRPAVSRVSERSEFA